jgi:hypothetical protein
MQIKASWDVEGMAKGEQDGIPIITFMLHF